MDEHPSPGGELPEDESGFLELDSLLDAMDVGVLILDNAFVIRKANRIFRQVFPLGAHAQGRAIGDYLHLFPEIDLLGWLADLRSGASAREGELWSDAGSVFRVRLLPYQKEAVLAGYLLLLTDLTAQKHQEEVWKLSFDRSTEILNTVNESFYALDGSGRITQFNAKAERLLQVRAEEVLGRELCDAFQGLSPHFFQQHEGVFETGRSVVFEEEFPIRGRWVEVRIHPNQGGGLSCFLQEITRRKHTEAALRRSEEHFRAMVNQAAVGVAKKDLEGRFLFVNKKFCEILGYEEEELIGKSVRDLTHPEDASFSMDSFRRMIYAGSPYDLVKRYLRKDGGVCWVHNNASLIRNEKGEVEAALTVIIDLTESKLAEEKAGVSETNLRIALDAADMAIWSWDIPSGKITWSPHVYALFGIPAGQSEAPVGTLRSFFSFVHAEDKRRLQQKIKNSVDQDKAAEVDFRIWTQKSNEMRWLHAYGRIVKQEKGLPTQFSGVMHDITRQKELEQQKDDFISIASHELKTPITSIKAYVQLLALILADQLEGRPRDLFEKMSKQVDRLVALVNDLLDTTRITQGRLELKMEPIQLNDLLKQVVEMMRLQDSGPELVLHLEALPEIKGDAHKLEEVTVNLIGNAFKYAPQSKEIIVRSMLQGGEVVVSVQDFGSGLNKEDAYLIFERFYRASDKQKNTYPGLGLGLYISNEIIKVHGGRMWAESAPGEGTIFYYALPVEHA